MSVSKAEFSKALELIHTALDRISQVIDPDFESAVGADELIEDLDEALAELNEMI